MANGATAAAPAAPAVAGGVPFKYGSNWYVEKFDTTTVTLGSAAIEIVRNVNPGGFLSGVRFEFVSSGGNLGGGTLTADAPFSIVQSLSLENVDGAPIVYPMSGWTHAARQKYTRPWLLPADQRSNFSNTVDPAFSLYVRTEIRETAGTLANTDARSQYRTRLTIAPLSALVSGGSPTPPTVTISQYMEAWAQPDSADLANRPIQQVPPGLNIACICRHQIETLSAAGADNTLQLDNTGNEIRCIIMISRDSSNDRGDFLGDPIRWRIDNRSLGVFSPSEVFAQMEDFYGPLLDISPREQGVYVFPRYFNAANGGVGQPWLATTNATYLVWEAVTATGGTGGTVEIVTDEVTPLGPFPGDFESM